MPATPPNCYVVKTVGELQFMVSRGIAVLSAIEKIGKAHPLTLEKLSQEAITKSVALPYYRYQTQLIAASEPVTSGFDTQKVITKAPLEYPSFKPITAIDQVCLAIVEAQGYADKLLQSPAWRLVLTQDEEALLSKALVQLIADVDTNMPYKRGNDATDSGASAAGGPDESPPKHDPNPSGYKKLRYIAGGVFLAVLGMLGITAFVAGRRRGLN